MSYYYDHEARKWRRNPVDDPYKSYREEEKATPRTSYTATEQEEDKKEQTEQDKRIHLKQHLKEISQRPRTTKKEYNIKCIICNKPFTAHKSNANLCSLKCRLRAYRRRTTL